MNILAALVLVVALGQAAAAEEQLIFDYDAVVACLDDAGKLCTIGTKRTSLVAPHMSAFRGGADIALYL